MQDLFLTETAKRATVVLPAVSYAEKDGTFTNTERCVQVVRKAMLELPGARADWEILSDVARALGLDWTYGSPRRNSGRDRAADADLCGRLAARRWAQTGARWPLAPGAS